MIEVDGSMMEGGGQLLRMAVTYSAIMGIPIRVFNIRPKRRPSGLKPQHLATVKAVADICRASTKGLSLGSGVIEFEPQPPRGGAYYFDIGTAGSISLLLQCVAPIAAFAGSATSLRIAGGTAVEWSPPIPILDHVVWEAARTMGFKGKVSVVREGFYPKGGGLVNVDIAPINSLSPIALERNYEGKLIRGLSLCGKLPEHVAERQARSAEAVLRESGYDVEIRRAVSSGQSTPISPGSFICLWAEAKRRAFIGANALGKRGKPAEVVGAEAAESLLSQLRTGASVDLHTADTLILWCSLAEGESSFTTSNLTLHTTTAIELAGIIVKAVFEVEGEIGQPALIKCRGIGLRNESHREKE